MSELLNTSLSQTVAAFEQHNNDERNADSKAKTDAARSAEPIVKSAMLTTTELVKLHGTIRLQIESTNKQSKTITRLTWAAVFLGCVQVLGVIVQIWISLKSPT